MAEPLVIVAAVNGGMQMSRDGAQAPITPEEIAEGVGTIMRLERQPALI